MTEEERVLWERLRGIRLRVSFQDASRRLDEVEHETFEKSLEKYWKRDQDGKVTPESICWFFCWAYDGMGNISIRDQCRAIFNDIFEPGYKSFDDETFYKFAVDQRYRVPKRL